MITCKDIVAAKQNRNDASGGESLGQCQRASHIDLPCVLGGLKTVAQTRPGPADQCEIDLGQDGLKGCQIRGGKIEISVQSGIAMLAVPNLPDLIFFSCFLLRLALQIRQ